MKCSTTPSTAQPTRLRHGKIIQSPDRVSVGKKTLRRAGDDGIEIDMSHLVPRVMRLLDAHENAGVIVRPFLDAAESVGEVARRCRWIYSSAPAQGPLS